MKHEDVLRRCVEILRAHHEYDAAVAEIQAVRPGTKKSLQHAFAHAGLATPVSYLAEPPAPAPLPDWAIPPPRRGTTGSHPRERSRNPGSLGAQRTAERDASHALGHEVLGVGPDAGALRATPMGEPQPEHVEREVDRAFVAAQREPSRIISPSDLPRALWPEPGEVPQTYAADRTFVAPLPPILHFGKPGDRVMSFPDTHAPYHDRDALRLAERCVRAYEPTILVLLGDWMDFYSVSFHDRSKGRVAQLDDEIEVGNELLRMLERAAPNATRIFVEGNHEHRLSRFLARSASPLHGFRGLSTQEALHLADNGWNWVPYHDSCIVGGVEVTHEVGHAGVNAARASMVKRMGSILIGHTHRAQSIIQRSRSGEPVVSHMLGWLGNVATVDYRHRRAAESEWSHGIGYGPLDHAGHWHLAQAQFANGCAHVEGEIVRMAA